MTYSHMLYAVLYTPLRCAPLPDQQIVELTDEVLVLRLRTLKTFFLAPGSDLPLRVVVFGISLFKCFHNYIVFYIHLYNRYDYVFCLQTSLERVKVTGEVHDRTGEVNGRAGHSSEVHGKDKRLKPKPWA